MYSLVLSCFAVVLAYVTRGYAIQESGSDLCSSTSSFQIYDNITLNYPTIAASGEFYGEVYFNVSEAANSPSFRLNKKGNLYVVSYSEAPVFVHDSVAAGERNLYNHGGSDVSFQLSKDLPTSSFDALNCTIQESSDPAGSCDLLCELDFKPDFKRGVAESTFSPEFSPDVWVLGPPLPGLYPTPNSTVFSVKVDFHGITSDSLTDRQPDTVAV